MGESAEKGRPPGKKKEVKQPRHSEDGVLHLTERQRAVGTAQLAGAQT